jgi:hypothetical protein
MTGGGGKFWVVPTAFMGNFEQALAASTNSLRLGDEGSYAPVAIIALKLDRLELVKALIPHLLELKRSKPTREIKPLDVVAALLLYSLKANQADIFVKALDGVDVKDIVSRDDLKELVAAGCEKFKGMQIEKIRKTLEAASTNEFNTKK